MAQKCDYKPLTEHREKLRINAAEADTSELVELLQQSAVEHLTTYRQLERQKFGSLKMIGTTDFEAMYSYKRGDYQQCLKLSTQNVHTLRYGFQIPDVSTYPDFIQLLEDDIVSLTALTLIAYPSEQVREQQSHTYVTQLTLSLYLITQCQLKLHHSVTSLVQTLDYIEVVQRRCPVEATLDRLTLKLTERKLMIYLASIMQC